MTIALMPLFAGCITLSPVPQIPCALDGACGLTDADQRLVGKEDGDLAGWSVRASADITGDGAPDLVVGAPGCAGADWTENSDYLGSCGGATSAVYVVTDPLSGASALDSVPARVQPRYSFLGVSVSSGADMDSDGYGDLVIGARGDGASGVAYVFDGPISGTLRADDDEIELLSQR